MRLRLWDGIGAVLNLGIGVRLAVYWVYIFIAELENGTEADGQEIWGQLAF